MKRYVKGTRRRRHAKGKAYEKRDIHGKERKKEAKMEDE